MVQIELTRELAKGFVVLRVVFGLECMIFLLIN